MTELREVPILPDFPENLIRPGRINHYSSIQILRGIAVLSVIIFHVSDMVQQYTDRHGIFCNFSPTCYTGAAGVDLFFIISGFVMVQSAQGRFRHDGTSKEFMIRRLIRIVPLYWIYSTVMLILVLLPFTLKNQGFSWTHTLQSYLFIPALNPGNGLDLPLLAPGWTLSYEMYFYTVFALLLCFQEGIFLPVISTLFALSAMVGLWQNPHEPMLKVVTNPLLLEFVLGCHLAAFANTRNISSRTSCVLIGAGLIALLCSQYLGANIDWRVVTWGLPALCIAAGFVFLEKNGNRVGSEKNLLIMIGDSSYSTYLSHSFVVLVISTMLKRKVIVHAVHNDLLVLGSIIACLLTGYFSYILCEKPISRYLLKIFIPAKTP